MKQQPHTLRATVWDYDHHLSWEVDCPYHGQGTERPCKVFDAAWDCEYHELGECVPGRFGRAAEVDPFGHGHLMDGVCGVQQYLEATSMGEAVAWADRNFELRLPQPFEVVEWDEGFVLIRPVAEGGE